MKGITKESIEQDYKIIFDMMYKYLDAIYEKREAQPAHFDNQSKLCKIYMCDLRMGLIMATEALKRLKDIEIIED